MHLSTTQFWAGLLLGALFLCAPAYYNLLPLWFRDTPAYMEAGFDNVISEKVVWTYGAFLRHVSLKESVWLVIFVQGMLLSSVLYYCFKYIFKTQRAWHYVLYLILISMTTAASFHSSHLMPDVFTPIMLLSAGLLLWTPEMTRKDHIILSLFLLLAISMHNSHWGIMLAVLLIMAVAGLSKTIRTSYQAVGLSWKKVGLVLAITASSYLLVSGIHYSMGGNFKATRGASFYLFARLWEYDIAQDYLKNNCEQIKHPICGSLDSLTRGQDYLWGKQPTSLKQQGGWSRENEAFFAQLNKEILTTPHLLKRYLIKNLEQAFAQLMYAQIDPDRMARREELLASFYRFYPAYGVATKYSRQHLGLYRPVTIAAKSQLQLGVLLVSIVLLLWFLLQQKMPPLPTVFTLFIGASLLANAWVVVSAWGFEDRLQSRVAWLITLPACWLIFITWDKWRLSQQVSTVTSSTKKDVL